MIEAVLVFALLTGVFELLIIEKLDLKTRLRVLAYPGLVSACCGALNLVIHWGTMTGSMTAIVATLASFIVLDIERRRWGYIQRIEGRYFRFPGRKMPPL